MITFSFSEWYLKYLQIHKIEIVIFSNILLNDNLNIHVIRVFSQVSGFIFYMFK